MGEIKMAKGVGKAIGFVFLLIVLISLVPTIFSGSTGLGNTSIFGSAPTYVYTLISLAAAIGIVMLVLPKR